MEVGSRFQGVMEVGVNMEVGKMGRMGERNGGTCWRVNGGGVVNEGGGMEDGGGVGKGGGDGNEGWGGMQGGGNQGWIYGGGGMGMEMKVEE